MKYLYLYTKGNISIKLSQNISYSYGKMCSSQWNIMHLNLLLKCSVTGSEIFLTNRKKQLYSALIYSVFFKGDCIKKYAVGEQIYTYIFKKIIN